LLITSELTNQSARKALFTCVVYTNTRYGVYYLLIKTVHIMGHVARTCSRDANQGKDYDLLTQTRKCSSEVSLVNVAGTCHLVIQRQHGENKGKQWHPENNNQLTLSIPVIPITSRTTDSIVNGRQFFSKAHLHANWILSLIGSGISFCWRPRPR